MTEQEINVAILEATGWRRVDPFKVGRETVNWPVWEKDGKRVSLIDGLMPNFCGDLNAMNQAELCGRDNLMDANQWEEYGRMLYNAHQSCICDRDGFIDYHDLAYLLTELDAKLRATCFLKALGKWRD